MKHKRKVPINRAVPEGSKESASPASGKGGGATPAAKRRKPWGACFGSADGVIMTAEAIRLRKRGYSYNRISKRTGLPRTSIRRVLKALFERLEHSRH